jgi:hypothetical protein
MIPCAYFIPLHYLEDDHIAGEFGVAAPVTIAQSDNFVESVTVVDNRDERKNQVRVAGMTVGVEGVWEVDTEQTAARAAEEELAIQLNVNRPDLEDSAECHTVTAALLAATSVAPTTYMVKMNQRVDLDLYQGIYFTGFTMLPTDKMRIIGIEYHKDLTGTWVLAECVLDSDLSSMYLQRSLVQIVTATTRAIARQVVKDEVPENLVGQITALDGDEATVQLETDGRSIIARVGE